MGNSSHGHLVTHISYLTKFKTIASNEWDCSQWKNETTDILPHSLLFESIVIHFLFLYRQKINAKNGGTYEERSGRSTCITIYEDDSETLEDGSNKRQELWAEELFSIVGAGRSTIPVSLEHSCEVFLRNAYDGFGLGVLDSTFVFSQFAFFWVVGNVWILISIT